ncbi:MAG: NUDIX hydrolase [Leptolyngbyaceae cyanobacterium]
MGSNDVGHDQFSQGMSNTHPWQTRDRILQLQTRWFTLIGEHLETTPGTVLEYWRIEKVDSVIVLPIWRQQLILPVATYRPGVGKSTLDFPGGRCPEDQRPAQAAISILQRELGVVENAIDHLVPLNSAGWAVNSSFSNQRLYGFVAHLQSASDIPEAGIETTYPADSQGIRSLLQVLECLQCRLVLREWQARYLEKEPSVD